MTHKTLEERRRENEAFPFPFKHIFNFLEAILPEPEVKLTRVNKTDKFPVRLRRKRVIDQTK